ncbi:glycosyltransferase [Cetobacterium sp.]|uniref:glycosyltransferase n=1 Tax=Cetobacterium sp. TaxID=2071632 RepID=UPI003F37F4E6
MKNIVFRSGSLRMGGLERVLIDTLNIMDTKKYNISLIIEDDCEEENIFQEDIPKDIDLYFLKPKSMIDKTHYYRERRKNSIFNKIMYNYCMYREHGFCLKKTREVLEEIENKYGKIDIFIDYDWGATRYIDKLNLRNKIVWIHNSVSNLMKKESKIKRFGKRLEKYDCIVSICDEMKEEIEKLYPNLKGKVKRIYNPFNFKNINKLSQNQDDLKAEEKLLLEEEYILAVSRLDTVQKDYDTLLNAMKKAMEQGFSKKLFIVGDGPNKKDIEILIKELDIWENVKLLGRKKNPYVWMKNSSFFVHSSKYEGFGLVIVEAMSLKKAVIVSNCKVGPKEILENGKSGKLYNVGDSDKLTELLLLLEKNIKERSLLEEIGYERSKDFSGEVIKKEIEVLIENLNC